MGTENTDLTGMLAKLEAMKAALEQSIAGLRNVIALGGGSGQIADLSITNGAPLSTGFPSTGGDTSVPAGAFLGKSIPEAAELYLAIVKGKRTSKDIAEAMKKGGIESKSKNFTQNVHAGLDRARKTPNSGIVKLDRSHWGLKSWYPAGIGVGTSSGKRNQKKKGARRTNSDKSPTPTSGKAELAPEKGKTNDRIVALLRTTPEREYSLAEIAGHIGRGIKGTRLLLGKLVKSGRAKMSAPGMYAIGRPQLVAAGD